MPAIVAGPESPPDTLTPVPATVVMMPVCMSTFRMRLPPIFGDVQVSGRIHGKVRGGR